MPAAIDRRCVVAVAPNADRALNVVSANLKAEARIELGRLAPARQWTDYVAGVAASLIKAGVPVEGCDIWIESEVPLGAGVSSSAALEVAIARALIGLAGVDADGITLARWAQAAENDFVGMPCGIMDQFASANGIAAHALLLDCRTLQSEALALPSGYSFLVVNSMLSHAHASGDYRRRREECELAARTLQVKELCDVAADRLQSLPASLPEGPARRVRHVVSEIARVRACVEYLRAGDIAALGRPINASHASLRDDMEVSIAAVDAHVEMAQSAPGVMGARMMGGGFGGCVLALVQNAAADSVREELVARYGAHIGKTPDAFICRAVGGAGEVAL